MLTFLEGCTARGGRHASEMIIRGLLKRTVLDSQRERFEGVATPAVVFTATVVAHNRRGHYKIERPSATISHVVHKDSSKDY